MVLHPLGCIIRQKHCILLKQYCNCWTIFVSGLKVRGYKVQEEALLVSFPLLKTYSKKKKKKKVSGQKKSKYH